MTNRSNTRPGAKLLVLGIPIGLSMLLFLVFGSLVSGPASAANNNAGPSLGISKNFQEHEKLTMTPGQKLGPTMAVKVDNAGTDPAEVKFTSQAPAGITVDPTKTTDTIPVGESRAFPFGVSVSDSMAAGEYEIKVNVEQTNVKSDGAGVVFVPAVGASFIVAVSGTTGTATVKAVAKGTTTAVSGRITIGYSAAEGQPLVPIQSVEGSSLTASLAAGNYAARFEIPGLVTSDTRFSLTDGENKEIVIEVDAIYFATVGAIPQPNLDNIVSAKLVAAVNNKAAIVPGQSKIVVVVRRDGTELETVEIESIQDLPTGLTEASATYVPATGWTPGDYTFTFQLVTPKYTVSTDAPGGISIAGSKIRLVGSAAAVLILGGAAVWLVVFLRRRKRPEEDSTNTQ